MTLTDCDEATPDGPAALAADHDCDDRDLTNAARWLSTHPTSVGTVVYYRCSCGRPRVGVITRSGTDPPNDVEV